MPTVTVATGASIAYEIHGSGFPVLLCAPGGINSQTAIWKTYPYNPLTELADSFQLIAMDQRNAGNSLAPLEPFDWDAYSRDQRGLLDALDIERAFVLGGCIGSSFCFRLVHDAPERIVAAVAMNPIGLSDGNFDVFVDLFEQGARYAEQHGLAAVVKAARRDRVFNNNPPAGPWANHIAADPVFAEQIRSMDVAAYAAMVRQCARDLFGGEFVFSVTEDWMRTCPAPLQIFAGDDNFHPTAIAERIRDIAPNNEFFRYWKQESETAARVRAFLQRHQPR